ncbi:hypothetical protein GGR58DRAFT_471214 [Xylaria digitata]|nr:hypothetical protein GGR58DRAFT_471214 [Xylaria digitata]
MPSVLLSLFAHAHIDSFLACFRFANATRKSVAFPAHHISAPIDEDTCRSSNLLLGIQIPSFDIPPLVNYQWVCARGRERGRERAFGDAKHTCRARRQVYYWISRAVSHG